MNSTVREAKRVVLCDDHEIVREAIKARMANSSTVEIVGEAGNGRDVVDVVKELEPDVLIIDVELPAYCAQWRVAVGQGVDPIETRREFAWRIAAQSGAMENRLQVVQRFERECDLVTTLGRAP